MYKTAESRCCFEDVNKRNARRRQRRHIAQLREVIDERKYAKKSGEKLYKQKKLCKSIEDSGEHPLFSKEKSYIHKSTSLYNKSREHIILSGENQKSK